MTVQEAISEAWELGMYVLKALLGKLSTFRGISCELYTIIVQVVFLTGMQCNWDIMDHWFNLFFADNDQATFMVPMSILLLKI